MQRRDVPATDRSRFGPVKSLLHNGFTDGVPDSATPNVPGMRLTPHEQERLLVHVAAGLARERRARGLRLNHPESVALLTSYVLEGARDGRSVTELAMSAREVLTRDDVLDGIPELLPEVQVEATFPDGTKLVTVHGPIR